MNLKERLKRSFKKTFVVTPEEAILPNKDDRFEVRMYETIKALKFLSVPLSFVLIIALFSQYLKPQAVFLYFIIYSLITGLMYLAYDSYRRKLLWVFIHLILIISVLIVGYIFYPLLPGEI